jgi:hypothetical protein
METTKQTPAKPGFTEEGIIAQPADYVLRDEKDENTNTDISIDIRDSLNEESTEGTPEEEKKWAQRKTNETMM